jgi:hypothetical protein
LLEVQTGLKVLPMSTNNRLTANLLKFFASLLAPFVTFYVPVIAQISHKRLYMLVLDLTVFLASFVIGISTARKFNKYQASGLVHVYNAIFLLFIIILPIFDGPWPLLDPEPLKFDFDAVTTKEIHAFFVIAILPAVVCYFVLLARAESIFYTSVYMTSLFTQDARSKQTQIALWGIGLFLVVMISFGEFFGISLIEAFGNVIFIGLIFLFTLSAYEIFRRQYEASKTLPQKNGTKESSE